MKSLAGFDPQRSWGSKPVRDLAKLGKPKARKTKSWGYKAMQVYLNFVKVSYSSYARVCKKRVFSLTPSKLGEKRVES